MELRNLTDQDLCDIATIFWAPKRLTKKSFEVFVEVRNEQAFRRKRGKDSLVRENRRTL